MCTCALNLSYNCLNNRFAKHQSIEKEGVLLYIHDCDKIVGLILIKHDLNADTSMVDPSVIMCLMLCVCAFYYMKSRMGSTSRMWYMLTNLATWHCWELNIGGEANTTLIPTKYFSIGYCKEEDYQNTVTQLLKLFKELCTLQ